MPTRRQLLGSLLSLSSVGLLRSSDAMATPTAKQPLPLDEFNASAAKGERIGDFYIRFTGLKGSMDDDMLAGQYLASGTVDVHGTKRHFVSTIPYVNGWGCVEYQLGGTFPIRSGIDYERLRTDPDGVRQEIAEARGRLLAGLREQKLIAG